MYDAYVVGGNLVYVPFKIDCKVAMSVESDSGKQSPQVWTSARLVAAQQDESGMVVHFC